MAWALDAAWTGGTLGAPVTSFSPAITATSTFDLFICFVYLDNGATPAPVAHTNMTWGSVLTGATGDGYTCYCIWGIYAVTGSTSFTINITGTTLVQDRMAYAAFSGGPTTIGAAYTGNVISNTGTSSAPQVTLTSVASGALVIGAAENSTTSTFTAGSGFTSGGNSSAFNTSHVMSTEHMLNSAGGSQLVNWSAPASTNWNMMAVAFNGSGVVSPPPAGGGLFVIP